ncbi:ASCH domain-containing protein [Acinetobacter johnsonii]|uniref:ASCH domain-containing protein n=2 Tax=Acinetobacter johnsonii TaxID=40214 RepID=A0A3R9F1Z1_ACIJO|nr:ASCH domain-containing protein [Acinetobacter johnsonii]
MDAPFLWDKMKKIYPALSIVAPMGRQISQGNKTLEIRSWRPEQWPLKDLIIVENKHYLLHEDDEELGYAVAMVDVESIHSWREDELDSAMASYWEEGYWAWVLTNVRPIHISMPVIAKRKIYFIEIDHA